LTPSILRAAHRRGVVDVVGGELQRPRIAADIAQGEAAGDNFLVAEMSWPVRRFSP
jgi:hypothetical protein